MCDGIVNAMETEDKRWPYETLGTGNNPAFLRSEFVILKTLTIYTV